ncbi:unnamed protein product [Gongylonema pulchrum]|uniref:Anoctamin n=1 Tax=Gongylonema pulchrum TaxID=637853 RepID=A0A183CV09_9BILA|nr:unnamed protein product [Gongylonema pulchrum]
MCFFFSVIQFGFVTLFVSAFPLAPLFALLNNIIEIRVDAYKYVVTTRRPMPERARDIGIWLPILGMISRTAVLVNACIIAFTSDFIPRLVYLLVYNHTELYGYVNNSLSFYDASGIHVKWSKFSGEQITVCRFRDYRKPPCTVAPLADCDDNYGLTMQWWIVFTFRLAFVLIFEHVVAVVKATVAYLIPDIPSHIFIQLQRQRFLARQARLSDISSRSNNHRDNQDKVDSSQADSSQEDIMFHPGSFDGEQMPIKLETIMRNSFQKGAGSLVSIQSRQSDSYHTCPSEEK